MKIYIYTTIVLFGLLCGCNKNDDNSNGGEKPKEVLVSLAFKGEILADDTPMPMSMSRAGESSNDLYGIQIYKDGAPYQYGLFDNVSNLQTLLQTGSKYKFVCTLVKDGKNVLYNGGSSKTQFDAPFRYRKYLSGSSSSVSSCPISTVFIKSTLDCFYTLASRSCVDSSDDRADGGENSCADRYYGELDNYIPVENGVVNLELKHTVFGIKTIIQGIPDGKVAITIKKSNNDNIVFFSQGDITSDYQSDGVIYECGDIQGAWQYADNYAENITVSGKWTRSVGVVQDLGSKEVQIKRNVMNIIRISLSADDGNANIGITTDTDGDMSGENANVDLN